jgi:hypothetical protein
MMRPRLLKFALLAHLTFSLGWLGAVVAYLALAIAGLAGHDAQRARAAYLSMELIGWFVIVPFSLATLLSGLVQSLGTRWGLFRHWWIVVKLLLTIVAIVILLLHMRDVSRVSRMAAQTMLSSADFRPELVHAGGGLLVLLAAATLSVFKPWGMTPYGRRKRSQGDLPAREGGDAPLERKPQFTTGTPRWARVVGIHAAHAVAIVLLLVVILHLTGGGMRHH